MKKVFWLVIILIFFMQIKCEAKYVIASEMEIIRINNADNITPYINNRNYNVENEEFSTDVTINYKDNTKIKYARYWFNSKENKFDNNYLDFETATTFKDSGWYKIEVSDLYNNITIYKFSIDKEVNELNVILSNNNENGSIFEISAKDEISGIKQLNVYINNKLYKNYTYQEKFKKEILETLEIPIYDIPFFEEIYITVEDFYGNSKTSEKFIINKSRIYNIQDLLKFRDLINSGNDFSGMKVFQMADLDLSKVCSEELGSWTPIGKYKEFKGFYEGQWFNIFNLYIDNDEDNQGFFGINSGTIKRIKVYGTIKSNGNKIGGINAWNKGIVERCYNYVNISGNGNYIGGISGYSNGWDNACSNYAKISGNDYIGGISGFNLHSKIEACRNEGNIIGRKYIGGITGFSTENEGNLAVEVCYNSANITGEDYVGGIAGAAWSDKGIKTTIEVVYNIGEIIGNTNHTAGLIGGTYYDFSGKKVENVNVIKYAYNLGKIVSPDQVNQISGGYTNFKECYYLLNRKNDTGFGIEKTMYYFINSADNPNSLAYRLNSFRETLWIVDSKYNNGIATLWFQNVI